GFAFEHILDNITANSDANGVLQYNNFHDFITNGSAASFEAPNGGVITPRNLRQSVIGGYIQDDIRASKRLMLNIGLRYEIATVLSETSGRLSALRNLTDTTPHLGSPFFANPTLRNFDPRVGFSYNPDGHGATAIRGGVGIYDVLPLPYVFTLLAPLSAPFFKAETASNTPAGSAPSGLAALLSASGKLRQAYVTPAPKRNYVVQWNFNVQRTLTKNTSLMLAYIGSRSIHLAFRDEDANFVQPFDPQSRTPTFPGRDVNGNPLGTQINPNVGQISSVFFTGDAYYDALEAKLTENLSHGLQGGISYTYGKSIDTGSGTIGGDKFSNSIASMFPYNSRIRRGPSDFDQRHNLVANLLWYIPGPHGSNGFAKAIAGGWQVTGEYQISTGIPFTPNISGDPLGLVGHHAFDFPDRSNASGCSSLVNPGNVNHYIKTSCLSVPNPINKLGDLSRNALTGPGLQNLDMAFIKNNPVHRISDAFNVQLRFETYNLANHANFGPPVDNLDVFDGTGAPVASGGQIDSTSTTSRQIQLGVKVIW
ncbi:MAG TPA: TonB-dependent receptor, partial [Acidobacteriaceae bacterium]